MPPLVPPPQTIQGNNYDSLKAAVLGSGLSLPEVSNYFSPEAGAMLTKGSNAAGNFNTGVLDANNQAAEREARANQIDSLKLKVQTAQDQADPSKYQQVAKDDGGYAFYDGAGNEISAFQYARATNKSPVDVLKNSTNPIDIGFNQDYKQLQDYLTAKANSKNDPKAAKTAQAIEAAVKKNFGLDLHKMKPDDVIGKFKVAYPTVFGGTNKGIPAGQTLIAPKTATSGSLAATHL